MGVESKQHRALTPEQVKEVSEEMESILFMSNRPTSELVQRGNHLFVMNRPGTNGTSIGKYLRGIEEVLTADRTQTYDVHSLAQDGAFELSKDLAFHIPALIVQAGKLLTLGQLDHAKVYATAQGLNRMMAFWVRMSANNATKELEQAIAAEQSSLPLEKRPDRKVEFLTYAMPVLPAKEGNEDVKQPPNTLAKVIYSSVLSRELAK